jgi:hypothetical protein
MARCSAAIVATVVLLANLAPLARAAPVPRFPVFWHVGSGYNTINGTIPSPGWPRKLTAGW